MRASLAFTVTTACVCTAALAVPLVHAGASHDGRPAPRARAAAAPPDSFAGDNAAGTTHFLPLAPLAPDGTPSRRALGAPAPQGVASRTVKPFFLLGITWNDGTTPLTGTAQARTRSAATGTWSDWQDLQPNDDVPDLDSPERAGGRVRGGTAPLWVGAADGVQVRVTPAAGDRRAAAPALPQGLRLDMVDPGGPPASRRAAADDPGADDSYTLDGGEDDNYSDRYSDRYSDDYPDGDSYDYPDDGYGDGGYDDGQGDTSTLAVRAGTRPKIISRKGWGADEHLRERAFHYTGAVRAVIIHHTGTGNGYRCAQSKSIIRGIYRYHVRSEGWRDIGYNFLVDKCGRIYEGRAGGVTKAVMGAHTLGFNNNTSGVAVIGTYTKANPPKAAVRALERLAAWKLGLSHVNAAGTTVLTSRGSNKYRKGAKVRFHTVIGHRDGFTTDCPGARLYRQIPAIRKAAAKLQGHR